MRNFVALDIETTGLDPTKHEVIEVGLVFEIDNDLHQRQFSLPFDESKADPAALQYNHWYERPHAPEVEPTRAANDLAATLSGAHIVGKNPSFDAEFIKQFLLRHGHVPTWHHRLVDVGSLVWGWYNGRTSPVWDQPPNSERVAEMVGVVVPEAHRHTALGDALWTYQAFRRVVPR